MKDCGSDQFEVNSDESDRNAADRVMIDEEEEDRASEADNEHIENLEDQDDEEEDDEPMARVKREEEELTPKRLVEQ